MAQRAYTEQEVKDKQAEYDEMLALTLQAYIGFNHILTHGTFMDKLNVLKQIKVLQILFQNAQDEYFEHSNLSTEQIAIFMENNEIPWIKSVQKKAEEIKIQIVKAEKLLEKDGIITTKTKASVKKRNRMKKTGKRRMMD